MTERTPDEEATEPPDEDEATDGEDYDIDDEILDGGTWIT